jgi:hypothetical protein
MLYAAEDDNATTFFRLCFRKGVCLFVVKGDRFCPSTATLYRLLLLVHSSNRRRRPRSCYMGGVVETNCFRGDTLASDGTEIFPSAKQQNAPADRRRMCPQTSIFEILSLPQKVCQPFRASRVTSTWVCMQYPSLPNRRAVSKASRYCDGLYEWLLLFRFKLPGCLFDPVPRMLATIG